MFTDERHQRLRSDWDRYVNISTPLDTTGLTRSWLVSLSLPMIGEPARAPNLRTFRDELPGKLQVLERAGLELYDGGWPGFATDDPAARNVLASMPGVAVLAYDLPEGVPPMVDLSTSWGGAASLDGERILAMIEAWLASDAGLATRLRDRLSPEPLGIAFLVLWVAAPDSWRFDETRPPPRPPRLPPEIDGLWLSSVDADRFAWSWSAASGWATVSLSAGERDGTQ